MTRGLVDLRVDGPFSDDYTIQVVWGIAEAVRVVNHSTMSPTGLSRPVTVHTAATALGLAATRLEATFKHLAGFLTDRQDGGQLAIAGETTAADDAVTRATASLRQARAAAVDLTSALHDAAAATSGLVASQLVASDRARGTKVKPS